INRIPAVNEALGFVANASAARDPEAREELLRRAAESTRTLQAGIAAIQEAIRDVVRNVEGTNDPTGPEGIYGALKPPPERPQSSRPTIGNIQSAPIDASELGATSSARPPGWVDQADRIARDGIDE